MDSWIYIYKAYEEYNRLGIVKKVFFQDWKNKLNLWLSILSNIAAVLIVWIYFSDTLYRVVVLLFPMWLIYAFNSAYRSTFNLYLQKNKNAIKFYKLDHQYLRYMMFKEKLINENRASPSVVADAMKYMNIHLETMYHDTPSKNNLVILLGAAIIGILSGSSARWSAETVIIVMLYFSVFYFGAYFFISVFTSSVGKNQELKRFLLWFNEEAQVDSDLELNP